jgi:preprotein translocase subunit SecD
VLGPAEMSSRSVEKATVTQTAHGQWVVDYSTTDAGAPLWDRVADENFHQYLGIEVDGVVYTAPLIQPLQSAYSSFDGRGELSGNLNRSDAVHLAQALTSHKG